MNEQELNGTTVAQVAHQARNVSGELAASSLEGARFHGDREGCGEWLRH